VYFNSLLYIFLFIPTVFFINFFLIKNKINNKYFLIISSLFFYSFFNIVFLPILIFSILINYYISLKIKYFLQSKKELSKRYLFFGIFFNISILIVFKYTNFLISNVNFFIEEKLSLINLIYPLALSFFSIQQIAYLVDNYQSPDLKTPNISDYFFFISFFPQLIAGPIVLYKNISNQIENRFFSIINYKNIYIGTIIFFIGLFKKVVISDYISIFTLNNYARLEMGFFESWALSLSYTMQIYYDFSGYSDMAIGSALIFGISLPNNFNSPYKSLSLIEFWRRWHITLSNFLTYYLFFPILSTFKSINKFKELFLIFFVMFVMGIWHGASFSYLIFGMFHGFGLIINHLWRATNIKINKILSWSILFLFLNISFLIFYSPDLDTFKNISRGLVGLNGIGLKDLSTLNISEILNYNLGLNFSLFTLKYIIVLFSSVILIFSKINSEDFRNYENISKNKFFYFLIIIAIMGIMRIDTSNIIQFSYFEF
jgi:alginate O-acetyltransferase complex protein AlgI